MNCTLSMVTSIDIVDTAVKIGLGALISGVAAYLVAKLNHDRTIEKEMAQRRIDLLERIAEQVAVFDRAALNHWAFVINWIEFSPPGEVMKETDVTELFRLRSEFNDSFKELISAQAKLLLIGEVKCQESLKDFGNSSVMFREDIVRNRDLTVSELLEYKKGFGDKRMVFFSELSNIYNRLMAAR